jgi:hypothetical protein
MIKTRKAPATKDLDQIVREVYDTLAELTNAVNRQEAKTGPRDTEGRTGDTRLVQKDKNSYALELRFKEGWVSSAKDVFTLRDVGATPPTLVAGAVATPGRVPIEIATTGVTPGSYTSADITVLEDGRISAASNGSGGGGGGYTHAQIMSRITLLGA